MLDHVTLHVSDWQKSKEFYLAALKPLGYAVVMEFPEMSVVGLGADGKPDFWLNGDGAGKPTHIAFSAVNEQVIQEFYNAALLAGGRDNGVPGPRKEYHPGYYGAFVLDLDGNNVEAVMHTYQE